MDILILPMVVFVAGLADVTVGTMRMLMVNAGQRVPAAALAMLQIGIFLTAVSLVVANIGENPFTIAGYMLGWGAGTLLAMWVEERIAIGFRLIQVINADPTISVADELRASGLRVTRLDGHGLQGQVEVAMTVIPRRRLDQVREQIMEAAPRAFITVERAERPTGGSFAEEIRARRWPWARERAGPAV
jgi:uncharacterized protein YebE (UPF0316 family)